MANPARAYLTTQVETTTQGELLLMLYEAAIKFLKRAKIEIDNKDYAKKGIYISKAMAIIHELAESLNKEKGGEITPQLSQLYMFCTSHLIKANIRLDKKMIDEVIQIMDGLRSAYAQIVPVYESGAAPTPSAGALPNVPTATPSPAQTQQQAPAPSTQEPQQQEQPVAQDSQQQTAPKNEEQAPQKVAKEPKEDAPKTPPIQQTLKQPPKMRSAFNAAKFRAANAYSNNR